MTGAPMMKLGPYLAQRLYDAGVKDLFGVPGDFSLGLFNCFVDGKINYVGCCNELNAAYAADGYARINGIGALATTYAVGELSAVNGIAGAWSENVPVVKITGAPTREHFKKQPLLHHTLGNYMTPYAVYEKLTAAQCLLDDPNTAARKIDEVLKTCLLRKKPVYIAVPSDMVTENIICDQGEFVAPTIPKSDPEALKEALEEIKGLISSAERPIFLPGIELIRRNLQNKFRSLTDKTNIPYVTMLLSKGLLEEEHPNYLGLYSGARSRPEVKKAVETSDCVVIFGAKFTDFNTGGFSAQISKSLQIYCGFNTVQIKNHLFQQVYISDVLDGLTQILDARDRSMLYKETRIASEACVHRCNSGFKLSETEQVMTMHGLFARLATVIPENAIVIAETGASLFSAAETMLPKGCSFVGQTFYGSIGFSVGACLGACMAAKESKRPVILIVGDGSFQLTAQEISTMIRYKCDPLVVLVNNDGYTIERVIVDNIYNDIQMWKYAMIPFVFGGEEGTKCKTEGEFEKFLADKVKFDNGKLKFVEVILEKFDCNQLLKDAGRGMALTNNLI